MPEAVPPGRARVAPTPAPAPAPAAAAALAPAPAPVPTTPTMQMEVVSHAAAAVHPQQQAAPAAPTGSFAEMTLFFKDREDKVVELLRERQAMAKEMELKVEKLRRWPFRKRPAQPPKIAQTPIPPV